MQITILQINIQDDLGGYYGNNVTESEKCGEDLQKTPGQWHCWRLVNTSQVNAFASETRIRKSCESATAYWRFCSLQVLLGCRKSAISVTCANAQWYDLPLCDPSSSRCLYCHQLYSWKLSSLVHKTVDGRTKNTSAKKNEEQQPDVNRICDTDYQVFDKINVMTCRRKRTCGETEEKSMSWLTTVSFVPFDTLLLILVAKFARTFKIFGFNWFSNPRIESFATPDSKSVFVKWILYVHR